MTEEREAELVRSLFTYDQVSGDFVRKVARGSAKVGDIAGTDNGLGYKRSQFNGKLRLHSHLAWLYMTGKWPKEQVDHINGNSTDDSFANLREATQAMNQQNMRKAQRNNKSGFLGVSPDSYGWRASITVKGCHKHLGVFKTPEAAYEAYLTAKRSMHEGNLL